MSSTCKYSNLPGIAFDQPDVYETKDVLELELSANSNASQMAAAESSNKLMRQHVNQLLLETIDKKSDSVEKITTKPQDAFNHFKGTIFKFIQICVLIDFDHQLVLFTFFVGYDRQISSSGSITCKWHSAWLSNLW